MTKALPTGARWITVRPNGPGTEGHAVMIQPAGDGAYRVIGGAGGKLNYLKLTGVRSEAEYAQRAKEGAAARRDEKRQQAARDREAGTAGMKKQAKDNLRLAGRAAQDDFVRQVAKVLDWKPEDVRFKEEEHQDKAPSEVAKLQDAHFQELFAAAKDAVNTQRQRLLADADMRAEGGMSAVPLSAPADPAQISVADLDPVESDGGKGLGFQPKYAERAAAGGGDAAQIKAEASEVKGRSAKVAEEQEQPALDTAPPPPQRVDSTTPTKPETEEKPASQADDGAGDATSSTTPAQQEERGAPAIAEGTAKALNRVREPIGPSIDPKGRATAKQAMALLRAEREMREKLKQVRERTRDIDKAADAGAIEPNAFVIEVDGKAVDEAVMRGVEDELRTIRTRGFLDEAEKAGATGMTKHVSVGAFNSLNSLALAAGGAPLMDRSVVDVLGPEAAAQALAHRLAGDLTSDELGHVREAMSRFHVQHYMATSTDALTEARELQEQASEIQLGEAATGHDLAVAQELNARRRELVGRSKAILAQALGEMETNAALVTALEKPKRDRISVSLGNLPVADAITRLRAIGLQKGDYTMERAGRSTLLVIHGDAIGKLTAPIDPADLDRVNGALSIMQGHEDEAGWLPAGVARRPDFGSDLPAGAAPRLAKAFPTAPADVGQAVRDYIGGRAADGDSPADIMAGLLSEDLIQRAGDRSAFMAAVNEVAPLYGADGKMIRAEAHAGAFDRLADAFTDRNHGGRRTTIAKQPLAEDSTSVEALHRALAKIPEGAAAFKPVGELTPQDQAGLRALFVRDFGASDPQAADKRTALEKLKAEEPERETDGMFGRQENPLWGDWKRDHDAAATAASSAEMNWPRYVEHMGSPQAAYLAMQDVVKGRVVGEFGQIHNQLRPDAPLRMGRTNIAGDLNHLDALDPDARERRLAEHRGLVDRLRERTAGRYASGSVSDKMAAAREAEEAAAQSQMGLFGDEPAAATTDDALPENTAPMGTGERHTIGHAAERTLAGMARRIGGNFKPGQPVGIFAPTMDGKFVARQRAVKLIARNRRTMLGMGVGSGKTSISLAAFTHLHDQGKAKRGLMVVPSVVQGQFHGEALAMLEPGKYDWHANPGASREERIAALKDPSKHFNVVTHQAFRDDVLHLASQQHGTTPDAIKARLAGMKPMERASFIKEVLHKEGIDHDYLAVDEGHNLLNRRGKEDSGMAHVIDGVAHGMGTYVNMTADPVKNDASEVFDTLAKMDPERYSDRDAFMRRYGVDTESAKDGLRREMARHYYTSSISSGVAAHKKEVPVELHADDHARIEAVNRAAGAARIARMEGRTDIAAMKVLSPNSFAGVPADQHGEVARRLQNAIGVVRDSAIRHAIDGRGKMDALVQQATARKGKPGIVFCHHLDRVQDLSERLKGQGLRVSTMTGGNSSKEKDGIKRAFQRGDHDVLVVSDAGAVGANLQKGKWLAQFDTPQTAMVHAQRNGRIDRVGQTEDVELLDLVANHPAERRNRDRLARKYELRSIVTSPLDGLDDTGLAGMLHRIRAGRDPDLPEASRHPVRGEGVRPPEEGRRAHAEPADVGQGALF
ncbi:helicase-related protein [Rhodovarius crocodyli]|nr:helicase-related protein [Rhodovarius crocodyli]